MTSALYRIGRFTARRPWLTIGCWFAVAAVVLAASGAFGRDLEDTFEVPGLDSQQAVDLLTSAGSNDAGLTARVVVTPRDQSSTFFESAPARAALADVQAAVSTLPSVLAATDPTAALADGISEATASGTVSPNGRVALVILQYPTLEDVGRTDLDSLNEAIDIAGNGSILQVEGGGDLFLSFPDSEAGIGELIGIIAAVIILLAAFGSLIAMGLPIGMALFGLLLGISSMSLLTYLIEIPSWAPQIASMVGLGVGIDYALFLVTRHREFLAEGLDVDESAGRAVATAGQSVVFAGGTVVIAILGLAAAGVPFMTAAGVAISLVVLIMVIASITLLPAFLGLAGHWINRLGIHRRQAVDGRVGRRWVMWGRHVADHAWPYMIGATALLVAVTAPVVVLQLGFPDEGTQPESRTERRAYDLVADGFGPGSNGPLLIAIDVAGDPSVVEPLTTAVAGDDGVQSVSSPRLDANSDVATLIAHPTTSPQDEATMETVERLRAEVFPLVLGDSPATAHIGGSTANFGDVANRVSDRLPIFIAAVIAMSFLLLTVVFRSLLVPLKAAILNLLSIGAAYGVLVMVFQWGWGKGLIGLETTVPIVSFVPMFMFAVLFGLSMDYEVFLLSRVRESYIATRDNTASVISGLSSTARVITSAALIMISVFTGFVLSDDPVTKMFGLGLATAILVDATLVRLVLVPATMTVMGAANWWLPRWLDRLLPNVDIDGGTGLPRPDPDDRSAPRPVVLSTITKDQQ